jgi:pilus assembly protein CpaB
MNRRLLIILGCALLGGAAASYLVYRLVGTGSGSAQAPMSQVVIAARDLQIGTLISPPDVRMGPWAGTLPKGVLLKLDSALNRGAIADMYEGEPILADRLAAAGTGGGLAAMIPTGMRASAVRVDEVVGLAGFVTPGMRVDVLMSGIPPGGNAADGPRVNTLLQNIQVLSAGANLQKDSEGKPQQVQVVNLLVTPEQAEKLTLASSQTRIQLILRNPLDTQTTRPPGTMMSTLFGTSPAQRPNPPGPALGDMPRAARKGTGDLGSAPPALPPLPQTPGYKTRVVEVLNGAAKAQVTFTIQENPK